MNSKILLSFLLVSLSLKSQSISTYIGFSASQLADFIAGPNVTISNASKSGSPFASGIANGSGTSFPFSSSLIMSTGRISQAIGPNSVAGTGSNLNFSGNAELSALNNGAPSYDAVLLEFDIALQSTAIALNYIFASEEYPEYVESPFIDAFGIFISGPGISGQENIALIPDSISIVSINSINPERNSQYYVSNTFGSAIEFDGYTTVLKAKKLGLIPNQTYHIKIVIADFTDGIFDSALFFDQGSLRQGSDAEILGFDKNLVNKNEIFTVFPNPTNGSFLVKLNASMKKPNQILIYDAIGNLIESKNIQSSESLFFEGSHLDSGVYFVKLVGENLKQTEKLLISK